LASVLSSLHYSGNNDKESLRSTSQSLLVRTAKSRFSILLLMIGSFTRSYSSTFLPTVSSTLLESGRFC